MPDLEILELDTSGFDPRDAALAHAIYDAVITRWMTLSYIVGKVGRVTMSELEPRMQAVLLGGAAQLLLMDRIPVHAVLDESVQWAKTSIRPGAGGMTNAILRKVASVRGEKTQDWHNEMDRIPLSDGGGLRLNDMELPEDSKRRLSVSCSLPLDLLRAWFEIYGPPRTQALHTLCRAPVIVYAGVARALDEEHLTAHESETSRVFTGGRRQLIDLLEDRDDVWVQDAASSASVEAIPECSPELVIDLCAGQGTKTRQLLAKFPDAEIWACEVDDARLDTLSGVFRHEERVQVLHVEDLVDAPRKADLVLADVPCTNSGVLARRAEARYRPMRDQLKRLVPLQRQIVSNAAGLLAADGLLAYATCSLEREENEAQAEWITKEFGAELMSQARVDPSGLPGGDPSGYWDGSFCSILRMRA